MAVIAGTKRRYRVIGLSNQKVVLRYDAPEPFDHQAESALTIPGFVWRVDATGRAVAIATGGSF